MKETMIKKGAFWATVAVALGIIVYYSFTPGQVSGSSDGSITILKNEVTSTATFYPVTVDGTKMEVLAVRATDGTVRTALNTCQVCFDSGRGYYKQDRNYLVCQNCGNAFHIDQIEKIKGGCNPVPIGAMDKQDNGNSLIIPAAYLKDQTHYFSRWKI
ncbi:DUF2318 domain-containing protein [Heliophilum fasciatum]|uniref:Putative membrane protein DUF2318 n=1 Tax=Heliophilum fasciatum TaxID=35700 RepID=A0A4R2R6R5_9FIRM|nr:DUF2318 domain-containing protein [Heliophilum fasciatum]MCW2279529.1 putative membrane protein [Heliophilum fasciatum]TCP57558.1 putative membrane protein DUF2318 [Heliophilum fasciatum]